MKKLCACLMIVLLLGLCACGGRASVTKIVELSGWVEWPQPDMVAPIKITRKSSDSQEVWETWDWNKSWELVRYINRKNDDTEEHKLYARSKKIGITRRIDEIHNDDGSGDSWVDFHVISIGPSYVIYGVGGAFVDARVYFYALGHGKSRYIGDEDNAGFDLVVDNAPEGCYTIPIQ